MHALARTIFVVGLSSIILTASAMEVRRFWHPMGILGYGTNFNGVVTGVDPDGPASRAGIRPGDRLDAGTMSPQDLEDLLQFPATASAGMTKTFGIYRDGARRTVTLVTISEPMSIADKTLILITLFVSVVFIAIGSAVVLLRPSPVTWGFYFFCLAFAPSGAPGLGMTGIYGLVPSPYSQYIEIVHDGIIHFAGVIGLLVFSLHFLQEPVRGWSLWAALPSRSSLISWASSSRSTSRASRSFSYRASVCSTSSPRSPSRTRSSSIA